MPVSLVKQACYRVMCVVVLHFLAFEALQQFAVRWRESTEELCLMSLSILTFAAFLWAVLPALAVLHSRWLRPIGSAVAAAGLMVVLHAARLL